MIISFCIHIKNAAKKCIENKFKISVHIQYSRVSVIFYARADFHSFKIITYIEETLVIISGKSSRQRPIIDVHKEIACRKGDDISVFIVLLEITMTVSSNNAVCERGFSCMNTEQSVLRTRLGEDTLDHIMRINIDDASLDNFDTEKFVSNWIESAVTLRNLNGHNSFGTEMLLFYQ